MERVWLEEVRSGVDDGLMRCCKAQAKRDLGQAGRAETVECMRDDSESAGGTGTWISLGGRDLEKGILRDDLTSGQEKMTPTTCMVGCTEFLRRTARWVGWHSRCERLMHSRYGTLLGGHDKSRWHLAEREMLRVPSGGDETY